MTGVHPALLIIEHPASHQWLLYNFVVLCYIETLGLVEILGLAGTLGLVETHDLLETSDLIFLFCFPASY